MTHPGTLSERSGECSKYLRVERFDQSSKSGFKAFVAVT